MIYVETSIQCSGQCCRNFPVGSLGPDELLGMASQAMKDGFADSESIRVARIVRPNGGKNDIGSDLYDCTLLGDDGRCTDYENRPGMCRFYPYTKDTGHYCEHCGATDGSERHDPEVAKKIVRHQMFTMGFNPQKVDSVVARYGIHEPTLKARE